MSLRLSLSAASIVAAAALVLTGCAASEAPTTEASATSTPTTAAAAFPRTITVPAGKATSETTVTVAAEPQRIAALSYETTALAVELGLADKLVMIPEQAKNPALTDHADDLAGVASTIPTVSEFDPELVIAQQPDLVLLTARHGVEDGAGAVLQAAGIPVLVLPNSWSSTQQVTADIALVGEATGADDKADALSAELTSGLTETTTASTGKRVLILNNQAGRPMVTAGTAFPVEMVTLAGAADASVELGMKTTGPITAEQVVQAAPDAILLIDMNGSGEASFSSLLKNPAVAAMSSVADEKVHLVTGKSVQALGLTSTIAGLNDLRAWVASL